MKRKLLVFYAGSLYADMHHVELWTIPDGAWIYEPDANVWKQWAGHELLTINEEDVPPELRVQTLILT